MCHAGVSCARTGPGASMKTGTGRDGGEQEQHNCLHAPCRPNTWISWLLRPHSTCPLNPDWIHPGSGFLYQKEIKIRGATSPADSSVQLRPCRGAGRVGRSWQGGRGGGADRTPVQILTAHLHQQKMTKKSIYELKHSFM